ncbi:MAG TPA: class I SAM-dependent methyltransferase [Alkalispirochaeta sp.]|nr:class I SAM-dependent methyltransferase [Alkalispirochaeta sp.]
MSTLEEQQTYFANRLKKRFKHLWKYAKRVGTNAFRVYHKDIPELPFAVDWYNNHLHVSEYARPHERTPEEHEEWLKAMMDTAAKALTVPRERVFFKRRERQKGPDQYEPVDRRNYTLEIEEQGLLFVVNLSDYVDTGLFLDHRELRLYVAKRCEGARFLNLFGYTGSFTVYAAAGGARSTLTLDLSNTYLEWAQENMKLNALIGPHHEFRRCDVLQELKVLAAEGRRFDVIVLDPPSFSNSKNMQTTFDVQRDHLSVLAQCLDLLEPGGELIFSTNKRKFQFNRQELLDLAAARAPKPRRKPTSPRGPDRSSRPPSAGTAERNNRAANEVIDIRKITKLTMPEDFEGTKIHHVWSIARKR